MKLMKLKILGEKGTLPKIFFGGSHNVFDRCAAAAQHPATEAEAATQVAATAGNFASVAVAAHVAAPEDAHEGEGT